MHSLNDVADSFASAAPGEMVVYFSGGMYGKDKDTGRPVRKALMAVCDEYVVEDGKRRPTANAQVASGLQRYAQELYEQGVADLVCRFRPNTIDYLLVKLAKPVGRREMPRPMLRNTVYSKKPAA